MLTRPKATAARVAEAVFTAHQTLSAAQEFAHDLRALVVAHGRRRDAVAVLPGIVPVLGSSEAEAAALARQLDELIVTDYGVAQLSGMLGLDLADHPLDRPLPPLPPAETFQGNKSRFELVARMAEREGLTLWEILGRLGGGRGHRVVVGTPERVADEMERWFLDGAADGFNVMAPQLPRGLEDVVDHGVPLLRERGLFRREYTASTLRRHYTPSREAVPV